MAFQIWNSSYQPRRIFGWREILQKWSDTAMTPDYVLSVYANLSEIAKASAVTIPLSHFLDFVNHEQEGIAWLLFEIVGSRGSGYEVPLAYVRDILDHVNDLDAYFPTFVGSPSMTIRDFVDSTLTEEELDYVQMMPPLVAFVESEFAFAPQGQKTLPHPSKITIRVLRKPDTGKNDDLIYITNNYDDTFNLVYTDQTSDTKTKTSYMPRADVLRYLSNTLRLMTLDMDPFEGVQFLMPNAPSVLLGINSLTSQTRDLVYDTVECMMDNWPRKE